MPRSPDSDRPEGGQLGFGELLAPSPRPRPRAEPRPVTPPRLYAVAEIVRLAGRALERAFPGIWVEGEVSNLRRMRSGHLFFSLKDRRAQLPAVMFATEAAALGFELADGASVRCRGTLRIYEAQGRFQLVCDRAEPTGLGQLMAALARLKAKLEAEGLFDPRHKRPLPAYPRTVGVVTSPTGAAITDILTVIARRFPVHLVISPTAVQGEAAPRQIVSALDLLERAGGVDVAIVGRGGGSLEDLWAFNDERVVRRLRRCPFPVISAVGHEIDVTLADLAADLRAATPSAAAELAVPEREAVWSTMRATERRLASAADRHIREGRWRLAQLERRLGDPRARLAADRRRLTALEGRLQRAMRQALAAPRARLAALSRRVAAGHPRTRLEAQRGRARELLARLARAMRTRLTGAAERRQALGGRLEHAGQRYLAGRRADFGLAAARLHQLSPLAVLGRGYSLALDEGGAPIRGYDDVDDGARIEVRLARGRLGCRVEDRHPPAGGTATEKEIDPGSREAR